MALAMMPSLMRALDRACFLCQREDVEHQGKTAGGARAVEDAAQIIAYGRNLEVQYRGNLFVLQTPQNQFHNSRLLG